MTKDEIFKDIVKQSLKQYPYKSCQVIRNVRNSTILEIINMFKSENKGRDTKTESYTTSIHNAEINVTDCYIKVDTRHDHIMRLINWENYYALIVMTEYTFNHYSTILKKYGDIIGTIGINEIGKVVDVGIAMKEKEYFTIIDRYTQRKGLRI